MTETQFTVGVLGQASKQAFKHAASKHPSMQANKQAPKHACKQTSKYASKQAYKQASMHASRQAGKQAIKLVRKQAVKHLEGIQSEPCPVGACFIFFLKPSLMKKNYKLDSH